MTAPYPVDLYPAGCPCCVCQMVQTRRGTTDFMRMALCPKCGDKRCRGAFNHEAACSA